LTNVFQNDKLILVKTKGVKRTENHKKFFMSYFSNVNFESLSEIEQLYKENFKTNLF